MNKKQVARILEHLSRLSDDALSTDQLELMEELDSLKKQVQAWDNEGQPGPCPINPDDYDGLDLDELEDNEVDSSIDTIDQDDRISEPDLLLSQDSLDRPEPDSSLDHTKQVDEFVDAGFFPAADVDDLAIDLPRCGRADKGSDNVADVDKIAGLGAVAE